MQIHRRNLLQLALLAPAVLLSARAVAREYFDLGREWRVTEYDPNGRYWEGVWTRRGDSDTFDAEWRDSETGGVIRDVIEFRKIRHNSVVLYRRGNNGRYFGELSSDGRRIVRGSASWYGPGYYWNARIRGHRD